MTNFLIGFNTQSPKRVRAKQKFNINKNKMEKKKITWLHDSYRFPSTTN